MTFSSLDTPYCTYILRLLFKTDVRDFREKFLFQIDHWIGVNSDLRYTMVFASLLRYVKRSVPKHQFSFDIYYRSGFDQKESPLDYYGSRHAHLTKNSTLEFIFNKKSNRNASGQLSNWCLEVSLWLAYFPEARIWLAKSDTWLASIWKLFLATATTLKIKILVLTA